MPQISIYLEEKENDTINKLSKELELSKADTIKKLIRDFSKEIK